MKSSILKCKSFDFAVLVVDTCHRLCTERKEFVLSKQLLKAGTSVGALIREAEFGQSRPDFISKMSIALKEANETEYWIDLLRASGLLNPEIHKTLSQNLKEILKILTATIRTAKANQIKQ